MIDGEVTLDANMEASTIVRTSSIQVKKNILSAGQLWKKLSFPCFGILSEKHNPFPFQQRSSASKLVFLHRNRLEKDNSGKSWIFTNKKSPTLITKAKSGKFMYSIAMYLPLHEPALPFSIFGLFCLFPPLSLGFLSFIFFFTQSG